MFNSCPISTPSFCWESKQKSRRRCYYYDLILLEYPDVCATNSGSSCGRTDKVSLKSSLFLANTIWWRFLSHYLFNQYTSTGILALVSRNTMEREGIRIQSIVKSVRIWTVCHCPPVYGLWMIYFHKNSRNAKKWKLRFVNTRAFRLKSSYVLGLD